MSAVLCLPACLCVSPQRLVARPPHGNASKAFHRRGVTHPSRATRGHQPRAARRSSSQLAARSAAQRLAAPPSDSAESVKEVQGQELRYQRVLSADLQGRTPSYSNHFHNHWPTSTGPTPSPVLHHRPQQPPQYHSIESTDGELGRGGQDVAAAPPPCSAPTACTAVGAAIAPHQSPVRRRHAQELRAPRGHGRGPPACSGGMAAGGRV